jgi:hypothetical protein
MHCPFCEEQAGVRIWTCPEQDMGEHWRECAKPFEHELPYDGPIAESLAVDHDAAAPRARPAR